MAKKTASLVADSAGTFVTTIHRRPDALYYMATITAYGTWGGGSLAWNLSPDGGTTLIPIKDLTGTAMVSTANDMFNVEFGAPHRNTETLKVYAVLTGSSSPSITIDLYDNN